MLSLPLSYYLSGSQIGPQKDRAKGLLSVSLGKADPARYVSNEDPASLACVPASSTGPHGVMVSNGQALACSYGFSFDGMRHHIA